MAKNEDYDVIVVGGGNAALTAALSAHENGARVLVLEAATEEERGGNSRFSGGIFRAAHNGLEAVKPILHSSNERWYGRVESEPYTAETYRADWMRTSAGRPDPALVDTTIDRSFETLQWMHDLGVEWDLTADKLMDPDKQPDGTTIQLPPGGAIRARHEGIGLIERLYAAVEAADIDVWYSAPASELIAEGATVLGVRVRLEDSFLDIHGQVVLAAGGFEANPEMRLRYLGDGWDLVKVRGTRYNMGEMLRKSIDAGAQPAGHWGGAHAVPLSQDAPAMGDLRYTDKFSRYSYPYALLVNDAGERFVDEGETEVWLTYAKTGWAIRAQPGAQAYQIFDQKVVHLLEPRYSTSQPVVADTLEELAEKLSISAEGLRNTVDAFNAAVPDDAEGRTDPFSLDGVAAKPAGQPAKSNWARRIDEGPFVCYPVTCGVTFTYGGLRVDEQARVITQEQKVMANLYAVGEIAGGFFYHNYGAGTGLMRGAVFGRIAGANAAVAAKARSEKNEVAA